jgi:UDP-N-acetylmuramate dehydrogenase
MASFDLVASTRQDLTARADKYTAHRKATQPPGATMGSTFKNPPGDYAGRLIEAAGLKGTQHGGAMISPIHANFFINSGNAAAQDFEMLIDLTRETVQAQFGVRLELEIELVGEWG